MLRILITFPVAVVGYTLLYLAIRTFIEYNPKIASGPVIIVVQVLSPWYWGPLAGMLTAAVWYVRRQ
jgi:hypothetical protein